MSNSTHSLIVESIIDLQKLQLKITTGSAIAISINETEYKLHKALRILEEGEEDGETMDSDAG